MNNSFLECGRNNPPPWRKFLGGRRNSSCLLPRWSSLFDRLDFNRLFANLSGSKYLIVRAILQVSWWKSTRNKRWCCGGHQAGSFQLAGEGVALYEPWLWGGWVPGGGHGGDHLWPKGRQLQGQAPPSGRRDQIRMRQMCSVIEWIWSWQDWK